MGYFGEAVEFEWDEGNAKKNWHRHKVSQQEAEQVFFNTPFLVYYDDLHSDSEDRSFGFGITDAGRFLFVVFTLRGELQRVGVISARDMMPSERRRYEHARAQAIEGDSDL